MVPIITVGAGGWASGKAMKRLRKQLKMNQQDFWKRVDVTQSGGSRYEGGREIPKTVQELLKIAYGTAQIKNTAIEKLVGGTINTLYALLHGLAPHLERRR